MIAVLLAAALAVHSDPMAAPAPAFEERPSGEAVEACVAAAGTVAERDACRAVYEPWCDAHSDLFEWVVRECDGFAYVYEDARLNAAYAAIMTRLRDTDQPERRSALRHAQRAWITWRDRECEQRGMAYLGGTMESTVRVGCRLSFTAGRASELESQLQDLSL